MIRAQSKARQKQMREYFRLRQTWLLTHPWCESHLSVWREHRKVESNEVHHTHGRTGALLLDISKWMAVCRDCHSWIGEHIEQARVLGLVAPLGQWNQTEKLRQQKERNANTAR